MRSENTGKNIIKAIRVSKDHVTLSFVKRERIDNRVYKNTYDNGKYIVINYSSDPITVSGREIKGLSSEVFEG